MVESSILSCKASKRDYTEKPHFAPQKIRRLRKWWRLPPMITHGFESARNQVERRGYSIRPAIARADRSGSDARGKRIGGFQVQKIAGEDQRRAQHREDVQPLRINQPASG